LKGDDLLSDVNFSIESIKTDKRVLKEYERLQKIYNKNFESFFA
jgi:hypothetical protein